MFQIKGVIRKILAYVKLIFEELRLKSNIRILFENKVITNNYSEARIYNVTDQNIRDVYEYEGNKYLKKYKTFLEQGNLGYYAYLDGKWVHRSWVMIGPRVVYKWFNFPPFILKAGEAYCHFGETVPSARGQNISAAVLSKITLDLKDKVDHIYTLVDETNYSSRRVNEKAGFVEVKRFKRTHFLGFDFYWKLS